MAIINKTGITNGGTIQAEHVTRIIDALSGLSTDTIIATGSFTGSFKGDGSQLSGVSAGFPFTGSARITGSLAVTGFLEHGNPDVIASGQFSHAEGELTQATGFGSHAEGTGTTASGTGSHAEGYYTTASGNYSHAEGQGTTVTGFGSHAEGYYTTAVRTATHAEGYYTLASGNYSHAEGYYTAANGSAAHAEGQGTEALGVGSHAEGTGSISSGNYSHAEGYGTIANRTAMLAVGRFNQTGSTDAYAYFVVGKGTSDAAKSNAFRVSGSGECLAGGTFTNGGADYAEYFESYNGQPIPVGTTVELTGSFIKICETPENAIGVISNKPSILGNSDEGTADEWVEKYEKDIWGNYIMEEYEYGIPTNIDNERNITYEIVKDTKRKLNPNYNPAIEYIPRTQRPEWNVVGLLGQIKLLKNQPIPSRWIKMKDINNNIAIYLVR
jgi:hypothetical protein